MIVSEIVAVARYSTERAVDLQRSAQFHNITTCFCLKTIVHPPTIHGFWADIKADVVLEPRPFM